MLLACEESSWGNDMAVGRGRNVGRGVCVCVCVCVWVCGRGGGGDAYMHELQKVKYVTI